MTYKDVVSGSKCPRKYQYVIVILSKILFLPLGNNALNIPNSLIQMRKAERPALIHQKVIESFYPFNGLDEESQYVGQGLARSAITPS